MATREQAIAHIAKIKTQRDGTTLAFFHGSEAVFVDSSVADGEILDFIAEELGLDAEVAPEVVLTGEFGWIG